jgi:hypothetical protein
MMRQATPRGFRSCPRSGATTTVGSFLFSSHFQLTILVVRGQLFGVGSGL